MKADCYDSVKFKLVKISVLRIKASLQKDNPVGILEWKVSFKIL